MTTMTILAVGAAVGTVALILWEGLTARHKALRVTMAALLAMLCLVLVGAGICDCLFGELWQLAGVVTRANGEKLTIRSVNGEKMSRSESVYLEVRLGSQTFEPRDYSNSTFAVGEKVKALCRIGLWSGTIYSVQWVCKANDEVNCR